MRLHSVIDIITNSSTEIFVVSNASMQEIRDAIYTASTPCESCPFKAHGGSWLEGIDVEDIDGHNLLNFEYNDKVAEGDVIIRVHNWAADQYEISERLEKFLGDKVVLRDRW